MTALPQILLVQMSGAPGSGKSTLARAIGPRIGAVVLDHDVTKTALLDGDIPWNLAGRASYETLYALARSVLSQGLSVILDSPCFYQRILDEGMHMAAITGARYCYVECVVEELAEIRRRLQGRVPLRSQRHDLHTPPSDAIERSPLSGEALFRLWQRQMLRPDHSYLRVDTDRPLETYLSTVLAFLSDTSSAPSSVTPPA